MNQYWINGVNIDKRIIMKELQFYLGPQATIRHFMRDVGLLSLLWDEN
jgi:hypothetical protein